MCEYMGREFGGRYPDSICIGGYLWDADSCDEPFGSLSIGGEIPCPQCNAAEHKEYYSDSKEISDE